MMAVNKQTLELQRRVENFLKSQSPVRTKNGLTLSLSDIKVSLPPKADDISSLMDLKYNSGSLDGTVRASIDVKDKNGERVTAPSKYQIFKFPIYTDRGTIISNGVEKSILNQFRLKPGAYTNKNLGTDAVKTQMTFIPNKDRSYVPNVSLEFSPSETKFGVVIGKKSVGVVNFLREIGMTDAQIIEYIGDSAIAADLFKRENRIKKYNIKEIYRMFVGKIPESSKSDEEVRKELTQFFNQNMKFGKNSKIVAQNLNLTENKAQGLNTTLFGQAVNKTMKVAYGEKKEDAKDDMIYKDVYNSTDLLMEQVEKAYDDFISKSAEEIGNRKVSDFDKGRKLILRSLIKSGKNIEDFTKKSTIVQTFPDGGNPLLIESYKRKATQLGDRYASSGLTSKSGGSAAVAGVRDLTASGMNKIDPVEVPEGGNVGLVQHLTKNVRAKNKTLYIPVYRVTAGIIDSRKPIYISPEKEKKSVVAFFDTEYLKVGKKSLQFKKTNVPARSEGKIVNRPVSEVQFIDTAPENMLGTATGMIPFVSHDDGIRALMGSNMQKQAVPLVNRNAPLVASATTPQKTETYEKVVGEQYGKPVRSPVNGTVVDIQETKIIVQDKKGKKHSVQYYNHFPMNGAFINNELAVKKGDSVRKNDMLAEGWQTKNGELALGVDARVGFMPYKGINYEDGIVISQSFAKKMAEEETVEYTIEIPKDAIGGKGSNVLKEAMKYALDASISKLDKDGLVRIGTEVKPGNVVAVYMNPVKKSAQNIFDVVNATDSGSNYLPKAVSIDQNSYVAGKVIRVNAVDGGDRRKIILTISKVKTLKQGDKLSGRHGNKGTVSRILPDNLMPVSGDKKPLDIIFSPLAVPSRKNVGQLFETNAGLIAEKTGKRYIVDNFDPKEKDKIFKKLEEIGYPEGKMDVYIKEQTKDGKIQSVKVDNPVTVGNMHILKLRHKVDSKANARSNEETYISLKNFMPAKKTGASQGEKHNPQSLGEQEMRALIGHGAAYNILESTTIKSDGAGNVRQRTALFDALTKKRIGQNDLNWSATPESLKTVTSELKALGMDVKPMYNKKPVASLDEAFDSLAITPLKSKDFVRMLGADKEVTNPSLLNAKDLTSVDGGLFDKNIFGEKDPEADESPENRNKWGFIKFKEPMMNPLVVADSSNNAYALVTGMSNTQVQDLANGKKVMITSPETSDGIKKLSPALRREYTALARKTMRDNNINPGDLMSPQDIEKLRAKGGFLTWEASGKAMQQRLKNVNVKKELRRIKKELKKAPNSQVNALHKRYDALSNLSNNKQKPEDLLLEALPVVPKHLRGISESGKNLIVSDLNTLYADIIKANNASSYDESLGQLPASDAAKRSANLYNKISGFMGVTEAKNRRGETLRSIKAELGGKEGAFRKNLQKKRVDFSARSVIGVNPDLGINEVAIPLDIAKRVYKPFIIKELVNQGYAINRKEAERKIAISDADTKTVINEIAQDRPVIINRQPSLHKGSIQAFKPIIKEKQDGRAVRNIQLNPLVVTGFNADFDGDTVALHTPITEKAKEEAKKILMPTSFLINPTNGRMMVEIRHEMALGLYQITKNPPKGKAVSYSTYSKLFEDYKLGKISAEKTVNVPFKKGISAGQALFNWCIPNKVSQFRAYNHAWGSKEVNKLLQDIYRFGEQTDWKNISMIEIGDILDGMKELGFAASTKSGVSIGSTDFKQIAALKGDINKKVTVSEKADDIMLWKKRQDEIEKIIRGGELPKNNPLNIMMLSGARAKADQIRKMTTDIGLGMNIAKELKAPIKKSHYDGLSPQDYYSLGHDSRKGIYDRSVATVEPGALSRTVWNMSQDVTVVIKDCGTKNFITLSKTDSSIRGRYAADAIIGANGKMICKRNQIINDSVIAAISKDSSIKDIKVRSSMKCQASTGVCQKCYGSLSGTITPVKLGTSVGTLASQAIGEPFSQGTMNTFHTGGANSGASLGLPLVKKIFDMSAAKKSDSVLAKVTGTVTSIKVMAKYTSVFIDNKDHRIPHVGSTAPELRVKIGQRVSAGDFLTVGDSADLLKAVKNNEIIETQFVNPNAIYSLNRKNTGVDESLAKAQDYVKKSLSYGISNSIGTDAIDDRHVELLTGKLTSKVKITDQGGSSWPRGQVVDKNVVDQWNKNVTSPSQKTRINRNNSQAMIGKILAKDYKLQTGEIIKKGIKLDQSIVSRLLLSKTRNFEVHPAPAQYEAEIVGQTKLISAGNQRWFSNAGTENVAKHIVRGATKGQIDPLEDPRGQLMAGRLINVGTGFKQPASVRNSLSSRVRNFFSSK